jgi:hypothetical protein
MRVIRFLTLFLVFAFLSFVFLYDSGVRAASAQETGAGKAGTKQAGKKDKKVQAKPADADKKAAKKKTQAGVNEGASSAVSKPLASGARRYILTQQATRLGEETYTYYIGEDKKIRATAEIKIQSVASVDMVQTYTLEQGGTLASYSLEAMMMGEKQKLDCVYSNDEIRAKVYQNGTVENISIRTGGPLYLLDNTNANNYQHIIDAYSHKTGGVQAFKVLVAQKLTLMDIEVDNRGFVKGFMAGKNAEYTEYRAEAKSAGLEIFVYADKGGAVAAVIVPAQKFTIAVEGFELDKTARPPETRDYVAGPYKVKESGVYFKNKNGLKLYSKLTVPEVPAGAAVEGAPMPAAVIIAGSGPTDRDGNSPLLNGSVNNLRDIAEHLAAHGIVSLRYDKRQSYGFQDHLLVYDYRRGIFGAVDFRRDRTVGGISDDRAWGGCAYTDALRPREAASGEAEHRRFGLHDGFADDVRSLVHYGRKAVQHRYGLDRRIGAHRYRRVENLSGRRRRLAAVERVIYRAAGGF